MAPALICTSSLPGSTRYHSPHADTPGMVDRWDRAPASFGASMAGRTSAHAAVGLRPDQVASWVG